VPKTLNPSKRYRSYHWGFGPGNTVRINDDTLPDELVEMGALRWLWVTLPNGEEVELGFPEGGWVAIDVKHPVDRLYLPVPKQTMRALKRRYWDRRTEEWELAALADAVGGRQAGYDYPSVTVAPIGVVTDVIYLTSKRGDGSPEDPQDGAPSEYIHAFGEESGVPPVLAVDGRGRLHLAGGNYTVPRAGIRD